MDITFGPVPSRRLGRSLGINNIPPKACSYACVYCQVGPTHKAEIAPRPFYEPQVILDQVQRRLVRSRDKGEAIDYLTFVPDGEPSLDVRLSETIERLRPLGIPIAIISNASLLGCEAVRKRLAGADWVSLKIDAVDDNLWRRVNRPHPGLNHRAILDGMLRFAGDFQGTLVTESMLIDGMNDGPRAARALADFLAGLAPDIAYLSIPTRPPAEKDVRAPDEATLNRVYQTLSRHVSAVALLTGDEGDAFASTGDVRQDLLAITAVHPMREQAVRELLAKAGARWDLVEGLISERSLIATDYRGQRFYVRRLGRQPTTTGPT